MFTTAHLDRRPRCAGSAIPPSSSSTCATTSPPRSAGARSATRRGTCPARASRTSTATSRAPKTGRNGRHPLPDPADAAKADGTPRHRAAASQVVAYDNGSGMFAVRLWWMLRWLGHDAVAVLDGGFEKWSREGRPVTVDVPAVVPQGFPVRRVAPVVNAEDVARALAGAHARAGGCPRGGALPRRRRAARPGRRAHSRGRATARSPRTSIRTSRSSPRTCCGPSSRTCSAAHRSTASCTTAAAGTRRATTCSPWRSPGSPARGSTPGRGASGVPTLSRPVATGTEGNG